MATSGMLPSGNQAKRTVERQFLTGMLSWNRCMAEEISLKTSKKLTRFCFQTVQIRLTYMNGQQTGQIFLTTDMNGMEHAAGVSMIRP